MRQKFENATTHNTYDCIIVYKKVLLLLCLVLNNYLLCNQIPNNTLNIPPLLGTDVKKIKEEELKSAPVSEPKEEVETQKESKTQEQTEYETEQEESEVSESRSYIDSDELKEGDIRASDCSSVDSEKKR